jgi:hypothetical protein
MCPSDVQFRCLTQAHKPRREAANRCWISSRDGRSQSLGLVFEGNEVFVDGHRFDHDVRTAKGFVDLFLVGITNAGTQVDLGDACGVPVINLALAGKHPPFAFVKPSVVLVRQQHLGKLVWVLARSVDHGDRLIVVHPHETYVVSKSFQKARQAVSDTETRELVRIVCPHPLVVINLAERAHSDSRFVVADGYSMLAQDVEFRREVTDKLGTGFDIPASMIPMVPRKKLKNETEVPA